MNTGVRTTAFVTAAFLAGIAMAQVARFSSVTPQPSTPPLAPASYWVATGSEVASDDLVVLCPVEVVKVDTFPTASPEVGDAPTPRFPRPASLGTTTTFRNRGPTDHRVGEIVDGTLAFLVAARDGLIPGDLACIAVSAGGGYRPLLKLPDSTRRANRHG